MRTSPWLPLVALALALPAPAHAQYGGYGGRGDRDEERRRAPTHADSTRTLAGSWQVWGHAGFGWLGNPADIRSRYGAGLDVGVSADRRFADRVALRAQLGYHDLPSSQPNVIYSNGVAYATDINFGHGWLGSATAGVAVRTWDHLWIEGSAGTAYFQSGFGTVVDSTSGKRLDLPGSSGWGKVLGAGVRFEFKPTLRDRLLAEVQFLAMDRGGTMLNFWFIRVGYRAF